MAEHAIFVGVSSCLLGERTRYDGGHKLDRHISEQLGHHFSFIPVCPEVECGLAVPREPMRLEGDPAAPRLVTHHSGRDLTEQMLTYCRSKSVWLAERNLSGFIFKKNSPSCGLWRIEVCNQGICSASGTGLFANAVIRQFPMLPVAEEAELQDPGERDKFVTRVLAYRNRRAG